MGKKSKSKKGKLQKFIEIGNYPNVFQSHLVHSPILNDYKGDQVSMKGRWKEYFGNDHPITLELACGKGDYAVGLAKMYPNRNFIGIDLKGNRLWKGATQALEEGLNNVAFIRSQIDFIEQYFEKGEVSEIWITFADPQLTKPRKRLTSPLFLERYRNIMKEGALMHLKTDSPELYEYTLEVIAAQNLEMLVNEADIYSLEKQLPEWEIKTFYEQMHLEKGLTIKYIQFQLN